MSTVSLRNGDGAAGGTESATLDKLAAIPGAPLRNPDTGKVIGTDPSPGSGVSSGSLVRLFVEAALRRHEVVGH